MKDPLEDGVSKVELIDQLGNDLTVVNSARVSMDKKHTVFTEGDEKLLKFLADNQHWTPFAHPQVQLRIKMPFFIAREHFRHEVGFARNEVSRRYVATEPELYDPEAFRYRPEGVKQGSSQEHHHVDELSWKGIWAKAGELFPGDPFCSEAEFTPHEVGQLAVNWYNKAVDYGVAPEWARMFLPQNMYTEFIETGSLAAYARLYNLRTGQDAQWEIRQYAESMGKILHHLFPVSWKELTGEVE